MTNLDRQKQFVFWLRLMQW